MVFWWFQGKLKILINEHDVNVQHFLFKFYIINVIPYNSGDESVLAVIIMEHLLLVRNVSLFQMKEKRPLNMNLNLLDKLTNL